MLPGKKYTPEDFLRMAWSAEVVHRCLRRSSWRRSARPSGRIRSPIPLSLQHDDSRVPQRVPESYVRSTVTAECRRAPADDQPADPQPHAAGAHHRGVQPVRGRAPDDDHGRHRRADARSRHQARRRRARRRRNDDTSSFTASAFEASQPRTAMQVTEQLASMFVQENLQDRSRAR